MNNYTYVPGDNEYLHTLVQLLANVAKIFASIVAFFS